MASVPALLIEALSHRFGDRQALENVTFEVQPGEIFGLLGPNGGGKTTLFRVAGSLLRPTAGVVRVFGEDVTNGTASVRRRLGIVFQSPALDIHLTVRENLCHHGHLYGLRGRPLAVRIQETLTRLGLEPRAGDLVGHLSGGLQRRVELAKALVHEPAILLLDEPGTGLDPGARRDVWDYLQQLRARDGTTVVMTTHLMDEASRCDRVAILHEGRRVALGRPDELTATIGGEVIRVRAADPVALAARIEAQFALAAQQVNGELLIERARAHEFITDLVEAFPGEIEAISFGKPTLEDVFMHHTGRKLA